MAYVRDPILILKDARTAIIQTLLVCQMYANCTVPQMIPNRKWSPKWTANDPRPQVIPKVDRKWSRKKNRNGLDSS